MPSDKQLIEYSDGARIELPFAEITINPDRNYSRYYAASERKTKELAADIAGQGQIQEVVVRPIGDKLELVVGFRRVAAIAAIAEGERPKVRVMVRKLSDKDAALLNVSENVEREDQSPIDQAFSVQSLMGLKVNRKDIAAKFKRSNAWITLTLRLLDLDDAVKARVHTGEIPVNAAYEIAKLPHNEQVVMAREHVPGLGMPKGGTDDKAADGADGPTSGKAGKASRARGAKSGAALKAKARAAQGKSDKMTLRGFRTWLTTIHTVVGHGKFEGQLAYSTLRVLDGLDKDGSDLYEVMSIIEEGLPRDFEKSLTLAKVPLWSVERAKLAADRAKEEQEKELKIKRQQELAAQAEVKKDKAGKKGVGKRKRKVAKAAKATKKRRTAPKA